MPIVSPLTVGTTGDNIIQVNIPYVHVVPLTVGDMIITHTPQGWQCPVCKSVYSPDMVMCVRCGKAETQELKQTEQTWDKDLLKGKYETA